MCLFSYKTNDVTFVSNCISAFSCMMFSSMRTSSDCCHGIMPYASHLQPENNCLTYSCTLCLHVQHCHKFLYKKGGLVHEALVIVVESGKGQICAALALHVERRLLCFKSATSKSRWCNLTIALRLT